ncbi:hypothetical protein [Kitasatospora sp. NPDC086791]
MPVEAPPAPAASLAQFLGADGGAWTRPARCWTCPTASPPCA